MSLIEASVQFNAGEHLDHWQGIAQGLCNGEVGVKLQDRVDVFGDTVAELLENLLEDHDSLLLQAARYEVDGSQISIYFEWPTGLERFVEGLRAFLVACGVTNLQITGKDLSCD